jgi:hypothetical protein
VEVSSAGAGTIHDEAGTPAVEVNGGDFVGTGVELEGEGRFRADAGEGEFHVEQWR